MAVYHVAFKMARGVEDDEVIACEEHRFDEFVELTDGEANDIWDLLNDAGMDNTVGEFLELDKPVKKPATATGARVIEQVFARLARDCVHA